MTHPHNPFEHHHYHHDPVAQPPLAQPPDPAQQSLADALRASFWTLKAVMLLLLGAYLASGIFNVSEQEKALRLRFGKIVGASGQQVLDPGGPYFALPYPIEQVLHIPTSPQQIELHTEFWYELPSNLDPAQLTGKPGPLNPEKDGSLLTGDANIIHARWTISYTIDRPVDYVTHIANGSLAQQLVRAAAEQGIVCAVAQLPADELIRSQSVEAARTRAQAALDAIHSGITLSTLSIKSPIFPLSVQPAVQAVLNAESEKAKLIEEAQQEWDTTLGDTAGQAAIPLLRVIQQYEQLTANPNPDPLQLEQLQQQLDNAFDRLMIEHNAQSVPIGGGAAELIHQAKSYRSEVVAQIRGEAQYFTSLLPQYQQNPMILLSRLWQDAKQHILTGDIETIYLPSGQAYLELNRDPQVRLQRERQKLADEQPPPASDKN